MRQLVTRDQKDQNIIVLAGTTLSILLLISFCCSCSSCWGDAFQKNLRLRRFKSDRDELWQVGRSLGGNWRRRPGRPDARWTDQLRNDTGSVSANLWKQAMVERRDSPMTTTTTTTLKVGMAVCGRNNWYHSIRSQRDMFNICKYMTCTCVYREWSKSLHACKIKAYTRIEISSS